MSKVILKFDLTPRDDGESDKFDYYCAAHGYEYFDLMKELDDELRNRIKYNPDKYSKGQIRAYEEIRKWIVDYCIENSLRMEMD